MSDRPVRLGQIWRRTIALGWPIAVQQSLNTLMRTVDVLVTGLLSPVAVAAIGLADVYARLPLRIGMGLGSGAIAISSQETARNIDDVRDRAITQSLIVSVICGLPFVLLGLVMSEVMISAFDVESAVVAEGGRYLAIVFAAAPMRIVGVVAARSFQGTGDTRTPMYVNGTATVLNILLSICLGLGIWFVPTLGIVGVGIATAVSRTVEASLFVALLVSDRTSLAFAKPRSLVITKQLLEVSVPDIGGGLSTEFGRFLFNSIVVLFGTEVTAAYHIANRVYRQVSAPLYRALRTVASILVGQELGAGRAEAARRTAGAICLFGVLTMTGLGVLVFLGAEPLAEVFSADPTTIENAASFNQTFAITMPFIGVFFPLAGALKGAGDTRTPFWAGVVGSYAFLIATSYVLAVVVGLGLVGIYVGIVLSYVARATIVAAGIRWGGWADLAGRMIAEREAIDEKGSSNE